MNKIKRYLIKYDVFAMILLFTIITSFFALRADIKTIDEIWNFSNTYKLYNGYIIYKDFNVVQTPLFYYLGSIIFKLLGPSYFAFKVYNVLIITALYTTIYVLLKKLGIKNIVTLSCTLILFFSNSILILAGANYNSLVMFFVLLGILINSSKSKSFYKSLLSGILISLIFFTKQNIGMFYITGIIIYDVYKSIINKSAKEYVLNMLIQLLTFGLVFGMTLIRMHMHGNLESFISYCVIGVKEFNRNIFTNNNFQSIIFVNELLIHIGLAIIVNKVYLKDEEIQEKSELLFIQGIMSLFIQYPIFNRYHIILSNIIISIYWIYIVYELLKNNTKILKKTKFLKMLNIFVIITMISLSILNIFKYLSSIENTEYEIYYGVNFNYETKQDIDLICDYISEQRDQGENVIILSKYAMLYMTPLKINNGKFDMSLIGNLGKEGEEGLIKDIERLQRATVLIVSDEYDIMYQESKRVREFIMDNFEYQGEIGKFMIYKNK